MEINKFRSTTIAVAIGSDRIMKLFLAETIAKDAVIHSIRTRRFGANRKTLQGKTLPNDANFDAAFLTLKKQQEDVIEQLPFGHIEAATTTSPEYGYPIQLSAIDWNTSYVEIAEGVALDTGKYFELTILYSLPKK